MLTHFFSDGKRKTFAAQVNSALSTPITIPANHFEEDSDEWLNVDVEVFEAMLQRTVGSSSTKQTMEVDSPDEEERMASEQASKLKDLASKVEDFVEGEGDLEGAKFEE